MQVRFMDWHSDLGRLQSQTAASQAASTVLTEPERLKSIPGMQEDATFDVVLGSDILYEVSLALLDSVGMSMQLGISWLTACVCSCCHHAAIRCCESRCSQICCAKQRAAWVLQCRLLSPAMRMLR